MRRTSLTVLSIVVLLGTILIAGGRLVAAKDYADHPLVGSLQDLFSQFESTPQASPVP